MKFRCLKLGLWLSCSFLLASCGSKKTSDQAALETDSLAEETEQPINIVVKKQDPSGANQAPDADVPVVGITPPGPGPGPLVPPGPPIPPPPIGVIVPDDGECKERSCGNGEKEKGEECDDGNKDNDDECDSLCRKVECGNGTVEGEEECDEPENANCTDDCTLSLCGNGEVDEGEECEPPGEGDCTFTCQDSECGNSIVEPGEECDDGDAIGAPADGCAAGPTDDCTLSCGTAPNP